MMTMKIMMMKMTMLLIVTSNNEIVGSNSIQYVCGYTLHKFFQKLKCENCKLVLTKADTENLNSEHF